MSGLLDVRSDAYCRLVSQAGLLRSRRPASIGGSQAAYIDWLLVRRCQVGTSESEHGRTQIWNR
jgi:hypothetical protein